MTDTPAISGNKLPVWRTVRAAYVAVFLDLPMLVRAASTWLIITTPMVFYLYWLLWLYEPGARTQPLSDLENFIRNTSNTWVILFELLPFSSIAVAWQRRILLREPVSFGIYLRFDRVVGVFAATFVLIALTELIPLLIADIHPSQRSTVAAAIDGMTQEELISLVFDLGMVSVAMISAIFLIPRLSIILPAKAVTEKNVTMSKIWRATRGQTLRLALGSMLANAPSLLLTVAYAVATWDPQDRLNFALVHALSYFGTTILDLLFVGFVAIAYRHIVEQDSQRLANVFLPP